MSEISERVLEACRAARAAATVVAQASRARKDAALAAMAAGLRAERAALQEANAADLAAARARGLAAPLLDRLTLTDARIEQMAAGLDAVRALPDPVGELERLERQPSGLLVGRMRIPLGVVGIIYEARPNVTADAAALCLKSGNACVLRGGSEAIRSNLAIGRVLAAALDATELPPAAVTLVADTDRAAVDALLEADEYVDLIIPRGGEGLIRSVVAKSRIPVIKHYRGVCHIYVDEVVDQEQAIPVCVNAKAHRPAVCNAMETLLVHERVAPTFLPAVAAALAGAGVELRGCPATRVLVPTATAATEADWYAEYLDLILAVRVVPSLDAALAHIRQYGSQHTEAILTRDEAHAWRFVREVDSSLVLVNASTRLNDGSALGLGAEIGISTTKLHAFGAMGLRELTTTKFVAFGAGQVRG